MESTHPVKLRVEQAIGAWREKRQLLLDANQALEQALDAYAHQDGPEPEQLKAKVDQLRALGDLLFWEVLAAVRAARSAGIR